MPSLFSFLCNLLKRQKIKICNLVNYKYIIVSTLYSVNME